MESYKLEHPVLAVDVVLFSVNAGELEVLLHRRAEAPFRDALALPGVAVRSDEMLENAARRALLEKAGWPETALAQLYLEQLATFDALYRDPRGRTVSVAYMGLLQSAPEQETPAVRWTPVSALSQHALPFDHYDIITTAATRLQGKLRYTNIARALLPNTFRIDDLQAVYEAILGHPLNRTNFRNKLLKIHLIERVSILNDAVGKQGGRPPHLYRFPQQALEIIERDFL